MQKSNLFSHSILICPSFYDGRKDGIGRVSGAVFDVLSKNTGSKPIVLSANDPIELAEIESNDFAFGRNYYKLVLFALFSRRFVQRNIGGGPKVIVSTHPGLAPVARILAWRLRCPYFVFFHGIDVWHPLKLRQRWGLRRVQRILSVSKFTYERFLESNKWAHRLPWQVLHNGLTFVCDDSGAISHRTALIHPNGISKAPIKVLSVARISAADTFFDATSGEVRFYKGFQVVSEAVSLLRGKGFEAVYEIVGDGDGSAILREWIASKGFCEFVFLKGKLSDEELTQAYREAGIFVMASEREGFGLVYVEAMRYALPCICVDVGASQEVVEHGKTGLVARHRNPSDLADKIEKMICDATFYQEASKSCMEKANGYYSEHAYKARILAAIS